MLCYAMLCYAMLQERPDTLVRPAESERRARRQKPKTVPKTVPWVNSICLIHVVHPALSDRKVKRPRGQEIHMRRVLLLPLSCALAPPCVYSFYEGSRRGSLLRHLTHRSKSHRSQLKRTARLLIGAPQASHTSSGPALFVNRACPAGQVSRSTPPGDSGRSVFAATIFLRFSPLCSVRSRSSARCRRSEGVLPPGPAPEVGVLGLAVKADSSPVRTGPMRSRHGGSWPWPRHMITTSDPMEYIGAATDMQELVSSGKLPVLAVRRRVIQ